mmetsp:Transcript_20895/g.52985  ORF Transcript_20895/g.52985 Transcript_20895/m.52985 type:complete len:209 (-) Transcript_20895:313-939(-)
MSAGGRGDGWQLFASLRAWPVAAREERRAWPVATGGLEGRWLFSLLPSDTPTPHPAARHAEAETEAVRPAVARSLLDGLEVRKHRLLVGHLVGVRAMLLDHLAALDKHLLNLHVVDDARVTPAALAEAAFLLPECAHAHAAREEARAVREQLNLGESVGAERHVLRHALLEAPLAHHEGIVDRETVHVVDAEGLHLLVGRLVPGQLEG